MLQVRQGLELVHVELGPVEPFFHVFRIPVGVLEQVLELDQVVLAALALVEHLAAAVNAFGAVLAGHMGGTPFNRGR